MNFLNKFKQKRRELSKPISVYYEEDFEYLDVDAIVINVTNFDEEGRPLQKFIPSDAIIERLLPDVSSEYFTDWAETYLNQFTSKPGAIFRINDDILPFDLILGFNQPSHRIDQHPIDEKWWRELQENRKDLYRVATETMIMRSIHEVVMNRSKSIAFYISKKNDKIISFAEELGIYYSTLLSDEVHPFIKNLNVSLLIVDEDTIRTEEHPSEEEEHKVLELPAPSENSFEETQIESEE